MAVQSAGGFFGGIGDVLTDAVGKYAEIRHAEKMSEITGAAQYQNLSAIERNNQVTELDDQRQAQASGQWFAGIDNKLVIAGGVGVAALLLVLTR